MITDEAIAVAGKIVAANSLAHSEIDSLFPILLADILVELKPGGCAAALQLLYTTSDVFDTYCAQEKGGTYHRASYQIETGQFK